MSETQSPPPSEDEFDIELFIHEIETRPVIWDLSKREYSDRNLKKKAWGEMCNLFIPMFETKTSKQKNDAALQIHRKWKSIRDRYTRERNKIIKSGSGASTSREYLYSKYLTFLNPLSRDRPPKSPAGKRSQKRNTPTDNSEERLLDILCERMQNINQENHNQDHLFLMSLVEDFGTINPVYKMDAKMEIMGVVKKYTQMSKYAQNYNQQGYCMATETTRLSSHTRQTPAPLTQTEMSQNYNQQGYCTATETTRLSSHTRQTPAPLTQTEMSQLSQNDDTSQDSLYGNLFSEDTDENYSNL